MSREASSPPDTTTVAAQVAALVDHVYEMLDEIGTQVAELATAGTAALTSGGLVALRPRIHGQLQQHADLLSGTGFVAAPGALQDVEYWLEFWTVDDGGQLEQMHLGTDPAAADFYDYTRRPWFQLAADAAERAFDGPYVDHLGANTYTITTSVPVVAGGRFLGVAASDLYLSRFERRVLPLLLRLPAPATLVNDRGRVIASTDPRHRTGARLAADGADPHRPPPGAVRCGELPMRIVQE